MLSDRQWKFDAVTALVSGIIVCVSFGGLLVIGLKHLAPELRATDESFYSFLIGTISFHVMALAQTHVFLRHHEVTWAEFLGWRTSDLRQVALLAAAVAALALPIGIMLNTLSQQFITLIHEQPATPPNIKVFEVSVGVAQRLLFAFAAIGIAPLVEEVLFRGILYPAIKQRGHPQLALYGTSLLFAAIHGSSMNFAPLFFLAIVFAKLYDKTGRLLAPILAHALFNAANVALFVYPEVMRWLESHFDHLT